MFGTAVYHKKIQLSKNIEYLNITVIDLVYRLPSILSVNIQNAIIQLTFKLKHTKHKLNIAFAFF